MKLKKEKLTEYITKKLLFFVSPMLKYELQNIKKIDSIYVNTQYGYCKFYIFYNEIDIEIENELTEQINNNIYSFIGYELNYEILLPKFLIRKVREYVGYQKELTNFYLDGLPKYLKEKIDSYTNKYFPLCIIRHFPNKFKMILPPNSIQIKAQK